MTGKFKSNELIWFWLTRSCRLKSNVSQHRVIVHLNINSLNWKIISQREILSKAPIESRFPDAQFKINGYQHPAIGRDGNSKGGGKIVLIRKDIIAKSLTELETKTAEKICVEFQIINKKWCILFAYRPLKLTKNHFFNRI